MSGWAVFAEKGNLMTYGPVLRESHARLAVFVDRILKGAKAADLPVERPTVHELVVNRRVAKELGIAIAKQDLAPLTFASHAYPDFHLLMPVYLCRRWDGEVTAHEGQEFLWVKPDRLHLYDMPPADAPLVAELQKRGLTS